MSRGHIHKHPFDHLPERLPQQAVKGHVLMIYCNSLTERSRRITQIARIGRSQNVDESREDWIGLRKDSLKVEKEIERIPPITKSRKIVKSWRTSRKIEEVQEEIEYMREWIDAMTDSRRFYHYSNQLPELKLFSKSSSVWVAERRQNEPGRRGDWDLLYDQRSEKLK
jgi:hypothetical protein